ncbi:hypothetical protein KORDIASMS9_02036 [Kordia sp. SMS9]|uniref:hypothetical protein n=1 Tax=Kordia sp. SMS9 TaxID=2282170 RepID=UPI000E0D9B8C|nr:hypothetical protein [Kordia sp. SMS9]AXG69808.1 hypothetical protein KORDIASMS9_02036 [Kordia sp. SMS9]
MSFSEENIKKIVEEVYLKAEQNCLRDNKTRFAKHVHEVLDEKYNEQLSVKTISRMFDKYIYQKEEVSTPGIVTVDLLCMYLGYENYQDYLNTNSSVISKNEDELPQKNRRTRKMIYIIFGIFFFTSGITIVWNNYNINYNNNETGIDTTKNVTSEIKKDSSKLTEQVKKQEEKIIEQSVKLGIFHNGSLDLNITRKLQENLFKNYKITFIQLSNINAVTLQKLQQGDINSIKNKSSHYYCIGTVSYNFRQAETNTQLIICELQLQYTTYDNEGNFLSKLSNTQNIRAHGFTKKEAQANTILKL